MSDQDHSQDEEMTDDFETKSFANAELINPPNKLRQKVGYGGFDPGAIEKAERVITENKIDFTPTAEEFIGMMDNRVDMAERALVMGERAIEELIYPAMQLKAQGGMFHYPLVTDIAGSLVTFLENITSVNKDVLEIVNAHKTAINAVLNNKMKDPESAAAKALRSELADVCARFFRTYQHP